MMDKRPNYQGRDMAAPPVWVIEGRHIAARAMSEMVKAGRDWRFVQLARKELVNG